MFHLKSSLVLAACLALSACASMAPDYQRPASVAPATWPVGAAYGAATGTPVDAVATDLSVAHVPWQSFIQDDRARRIVDLVLLNNRDLRKAVANLESARALYRVQDAALTPTISAGGGASRARRLSGVGNTTATGNASSLTIGTTAYELDLFGKVRSLSDAALETYLSTQESVRATRISLIGETAIAYVTLAADSSRLVEAQATSESARRSMEVTTRRKEAGVASRIDVRQAETIYQQARADVANFTSLVAQDRNALELLAGQPLSDDLLPASLDDGGTWFASLAPGVRSDVLLARPDVLQAEHDLRSANANIGAARAAFFPSISLTAEGGRSSNSLSGLFGGGATIWSFAPSISLPIFDGGANRANLAYSEAQRDLFLSTYEQTVQTAFKEAADALARRGTLDEQMAAQQALVEAATDTYRIAEARYRRGIDTYLNTLDAQRTMYNSRQSLLDMRALALTNRVTLYQVLGGGSACTTEGCS